MIDLDARRWEVSRPEAVALQRVLGYKTTRRWRLVHLEPPSMMSPNRLVILSLVALTAVACRAADHVVSVADGGTVNARRRPAPFV